jgi:elongation factor Ts
MSMAATIEEIKKLREATGAGIMDCRKALEQSDGDYDRALEFLREKGIATAAKRADRQASEGVVELYSHGNGRVGVMVEINCETDFVARSEAFRTFAHEIALQIAASAPKYIRESDIPAEALEELNKDEAALLRQPYIRDESITIENLLMQNVAAIGENIVIRRFARWELGESTAS